jgi:1,2-phenylacetyl-CoA epoxidase PaaB subunit
MRQQTYLKKQENVGIWILNSARLHQISFSYVTTSYPPNKEIKMSEYVKKKYINKKTKRNTFQSNKDVIKIN